MKKPIITYGMDGWEIVVKNVWNQTVNSIHDKGSGVPRAEVFVKTCEGKYIIADMTVMYLGLIKIIKHCMEEYDEIAVLFTMELVEHGIDKESSPILEKMTIIKDVKEVEKSYTGVLKTVIASPISNLGFFISKDDVEKLTNNFNLDFELGPGDILGEKSALFIYKRNVIRLKLKSIGWLIYHGEHQENSTKITGDQS